MKAEQIIATDIQKSLVRMGYNVPAIATTGEEAIRKVEETPPDLVLMDIVLRNGIDGIETAQGNSPPPQHSYRLSHGFFGRRNGQSGEKPQPSGYLLKPFEKKELYTTIEMALVMNTLRHIRGTESTPSWLVGVHR